MPGNAASTIVRESDCRDLRRAIGRRRIILASTSPRRRQILSECGIHVTVSRPGVAEPEPGARDLRSWVRRWALRKAESVAKSTHHGLIVAADTIVVLGGHAMGKPTDADDARSMLKRLSGRTHHVITGVAVLDANRQTQAAGSTASLVRFRKLAPTEIDRYLATKEPWDKAGAYAIQGYAGRFVEHVKGPLDNVVGLPVQRLARLIERVTDR